jgi:hypothetical protein
MTAAVALTAQKNETPKRRSAETDKCVKVGLAAGSETTYGHSTLAMHTDTHKENRASGKTNHIV